jgi:hypothetical protein
MARNVNPKFDQENRHNDEYQQRRNSALFLTLSFSQSFGGHGKWATWLQDHAKISQSTATRYMHVAENSSKLQNVTNLTEKTLTEFYSDLELIKIPQTQTKTGTRSSPQPSVFVQVQGLVLRISHMLTPSLKQQTPRRKQQTVARQPLQINPLINISLQRSGFFSFAWWPS